MKALILATIVAMPAFAGDCPVPQPLTCKQLEQKIAQRCQEPTDALVCRDAIARATGAATAQAQARCPQRDCKAENHAAYDSGYHNATADMLYTTFPKQKPRGNWLVGPTVSFADGAAIGAMGGYQFGNPKAPAVLGAVTYGHTDGGSTTGLVHKCYGTLPYDGENHVGVGVSLLWKVGH